MPDENPADLLSKCPKRGELLPGTIREGFPGCSSVKKKSG